MKFNFDKNTKVIILFLLISLFTVKTFDTPYNIYSLLNWNYEDRMEQEYGYCQKESWGFYNDIEKKFKLKNENIRIINYEGYVTLEPFFNFNKKLENLDINSKYLIILNYQSKNNENIYSSKYEFIKNYKIKYRQNNCYLLELND